MNECKCGRKLEYIVHGYYFTSRLCTHCLEFRKIECAKCYEKIPVYTYPEDFSGDSGRGLLCQNCIDKFKINFG